MIHIVILAAIQGAAELLPVSSSAHVIVAEKLMGLDPSAPQMTFLLVMLHTGTMFAVLLYFWNRWKKLLRERRGFLRAVIVATAVTGFVGLGLKVLIEKVILEKLLGHSKGEVEQLFQYLPLMAVNLLLIGALILWSARGSLRSADATSASARSQRPVGGNPFSDSDSAAIGLVQAICLPLRGFSRSGATISVGLMRNLARPLAEDFSFALAVLLTPPVIFLEAHRLFRASASQLAFHSSDLAAMLEPGLLGMVFSFIAGLLALKWLSRWLEAGKWQYFGYYCLIASVIVMGLQFSAFWRG